MEKNISNVISILKGNVIFSLARYYNFFLQNIASSHLLSMLPWVFKDANILKLTHTKKWNTFSAEISLFKFLANFYIFLSKI